MIYLPLEHIEQRYTTHLDRDILEYLDRKGIPYTYVKPTVLANEIRKGSFLDAENTCYRQFTQMAEVMALLIQDKVKRDETIFVTDIWNFALLCVPYVNFFTDRRLKVRGVLHAGSFTDTDFVRRMERVYKGMEESLFDICDRIFVASDFIRKDVISKRYVDERKLRVTGLPLDFRGLAPYVGRYGKENLIVFNGRNVDEKQPYLFDLLRRYRPQYGYVNTQALGLSKQGYYETLSRARCVVSFALQENFGFGVQEAVYLGCVPVLPDRLAYREQFDKAYLYRDFNGCLDLVDKAMSGALGPTRVSYPDNDRIFGQWFSED